MVKFEHLVFSKHPSGPSGQLQCRHFRDDMRPFSVMLVPYNKDGRPGIFFELNWMDDVEDPIWGLTDEELIEEINAAPASA